MKFKEYFLIGEGLTRAGVMGHALGGGIDSEYWIFPSGNIQNCDYHKGGDSHAQIVLNHLQQEIINDLSNGAETWGDFIKEYAEIVREEGFEPEYEPEDDDELVMMYLIETQKISDKVYDCLHYRETDKLVAYGVLELEWIRVIGTNIMMESPLTMDKLSTLNAGLENIFMHEGGLPEDDNAVHFLIMMMIEEHGVDVRDHEYDDVPYSAIKEMNLTSIARS